MVRLAPSLTLLIRSLSQSRKIQIPDGKQPKESRARVVRRKRTTWYFQRVQALSRRLKEGSSRSGEARKEVGEAAVIKRDQDQDRGFEDGISSSVAEREETREIIEIQKPEFPEFTFYAKCNQGKAKKVSCTSSGASKHPHGTYTASLH